MSSWLRKEFSGAGIPLGAFCIALNLMLGQVTALIKLPLYLDSFGTVLMAVLAGPLSAAVIGFLSNVIGAGLINPPMLFFAPVSIVIALFTGLVARMGGFRALPSVMIFGLLQGTLAASISAPIAAYLFGGVMMSGTDLLVIFFRSLGFSLLESNFFQGMISDSFDKLVTYTTVLLLLRRLPDRLLSRFPGSTYLKHA